MKELRYTLLSDGSSDQVLIPIIRWLIRDLGVTCPVQSEWADLSRVSRSRISSLSARLATAVELYPCDLLFVHRDAEGQPREQRVQEIDQEIQQAAKAARLPAHVPVVPVRMQEAWLLFCAGAIRRAANNPSGTMDLRLPALSDLEGIADPKAALHEALRRASGLGAQRRKRLNTHRAVHGVAYFARDFAPLRKLSAFKALEQDTHNVLQSLGLLP